MMFGNIIIMCHGGVVGNASTTVWMELSYHDNSSVNGKNYPSFWLIN